MSLPAAVPRHLYPFEGRTFDRGGGIRMHYLDEGGDGAAEPVVMVHGNPTWSFHFRELVLRLRDRHRCVVPDHVGMGLSDKPSDAAYTYTLRSRVDDLERLLEHAGVTRDVTLIAHDWGGMIAMAWAVRHPERVARIVVMNTAAFHLPKDKSFPPALALTRTPLGALLVRGGNAFARTATRVCTTRRTLPREVRRAYVAPYDSWQNRIATLRFVEDIPLRPADPAYRVVSETADRLSTLAHVPMLLCWGLRDFVFSREFLAEWRRRFPRAEVLALEDAGHYVLEDAPDEVGGAIERFLAANPLRAAVHA